MKKYSIYLSILFLCSIGCTTVRVTKVTDGGNEKGLRYALGRPYIQVTPSTIGDGTYSVEVIYLPDQNQTYAVETSSFLAKNTMEISVDENGILKKIDWNANSDATVSQATQTLGTLAKTELERTTKLKDEAEAVSKEKKKTAQAAIEAIQEKVDQKEIDLQIAKKDEATLSAAYTGQARTAEIKEKLRLSRLTITRLEADLKLLKSKLKAAQKVSTDLSASLNNPSGDNDQTAWGPVFFQIDEGKDANNKPTLALKAVPWATNKNQLSFQTVSKVEPDKPAVKAPKLTTTGTLTSTYAGNGTTTLKVTFDSDITTIDLTQSKFTADQGENPEFKVKYNITNNKEVNFIFNKKDIPAGSYTVDLWYSYKNGDEQKEVTATFKLILN